MSHFTVLVIGENPEAQLEPYSENLETEEYIHHKVSEEEKKEFISYYLNKENNQLYFPFLVLFDELYQKYGESWNNNAWRYEKDGSLNEYSCYNPNSKWDWHTLGGRWQGFFKLKKDINCIYSDISSEEILDLIQLYRFNFESYEKQIKNYPAYIDTFIEDQSEDFFTDSALKKDIDFEFKINKNRIKAEKEYNVFKKYFSNIKNHRNFSEYSRTERELYLNQDSVNLLNKLRKTAAEEEINILYRINLDELFNISEEKYIKKAEDTAFQTFAVLKDGKWYEKGKIGYFACVSGENENWDEIFLELFNSTGENELLSLYDCHI